MVLVLVYSEKKIDCRECVIVDRAEKASSECEHGEQD